MQGGARVLPIPNGVVYRPGALAQRRLPAPQEAGATRRPARWVVGVILHPAGFAQPGARIRGADEPAALRTCV